MLRMTIDDEDDEDYEADDDDDFDWQTVSTDGREGTCQYLVGT